MDSPSSPIEATSSPPGPPSAMPLPLPPPPSSRRFPPPCWSHDETVALIDEYRDKWYSLARGNLKATHWQEVADAVTRRCPNVSPAKTAVQCRHKMEKLRKRYRTEIQRARSLPMSKFISSWVHFKRMDALEKGLSAAKPEINSGSGDDNDDQDEDQDQDLYEEFKNGSASNTRSLNKLSRNGIGGSGGSNSGGFRIRIPTAVSIAQPGSSHYGRTVDQRFNPNVYPNQGSHYGGSNLFPRDLKEKGSTMLGKRDKERDPVGEMVSAIKVLRDGFVRVEQMKMEMTREIETMRMDMEMKRTEMILESQQRIVEAFAKAVSMKKETKGMSSPPES